MALWASFWCLWSLSNGCSAGFGEIEQNHTGGVAFAEQALTEANNGGRDPSQLEQPIEAESASIVSSQAPAKRELYRGQLGQRHDMGGPEIHQSQFSLRVCVLGPKALMGALSYERNRGSCAVAASAVVYGPWPLPMPSMGSYLVWPAWLPNYGATIGTLALILVAMPLKYGTAAAFTKIYVSLFSSKRRFSNVTACDARRQEVEVSQLGEEREDGHGNAQATGVLPLMLGALHDPQRDEHGPHTHAKGREVEEREELPIECDLGVREAIARGHADGQRDMVREAAMLVEAHVPALHCIVRSSVGQRSHRKSRMIRTRACVQKPNVDSWTTWVSGEHGDFVPIHVCLRSVHHRVRWGTESAAQSGHARVRECGPGAARSAGRAPPRADLECAVVQDGSCAPASHRRAGCKLRDGVPPDAGAGPDWPPASCGMEAARLRPTAVRVASCAPASHPTLVWPRAASRVPPDASVAPRLATPAPCEPHPDLVF
ncbi:hypothetical protein JB92DRAFT_3093502 [Gautieria morchelliformis]|nr:hypothetical protein JB92DRAFT_3093502 [Gautieria morchelliformis]